MLVGAVQAPAPAPRRGSKAATLPLTLLAATPRPSCRSRLDAVWAMTAEGDQENDTPGENETPLALRAFVLGC